MSARSQRDTWERSALGCCHLLEDRSSPDLTVDADLEEGLLPAAGPERNLPPSSRQPDQALTSHAWRFETASAWDQSFGGAGDDTLVVARTASCNHAWPA